MRILIIDDNSAYRDAVSRASINKGWDPISCRDIATAKQIIQSKLPDLIISDYLLHNETVVDLLYWMKSKSVNIPVIVVSASDEEELSDTALKNGADRFYDKLDFNLKKIYETLEEWQD